MEDSGLKKSEERQHCIRELESPHENFLELGRKLRFKIKYMGTVDISRGFGIFQKLKQKTDGPKYKQNPRAV